MKFSIYPTNNSWSYKVLAKINNNVFDSKVPSNICIYSWLSMFYGLAAINLLVMVITALEFLSEAYFDTDIILASILLESTYYLVSVGAILGFLLAVLVWTITVYVIVFLLLPITLLLMILYPFFQDNVDNTNVKSFVISLLQVVCYSAIDNKLTKIISSCIINLWKLTRFIKCKTLNFDEEK